MKKLPEYGESPAKPYRITFARQVMPVSAIISGISLMPYQRSRGRCVNVVLLDMWTTHVARPRLNPDASMAFCKGSYLKHGAAKNGVYPEA